jgi:transposase
MTKAEVKVITSVQRRRYWSRAEKERIVAAAMEPDAVASDVARAAGIHTSQLFRWRRQLCERARIPALFNPVTVAPEETAPSSALSPMPEGTGPGSPEACGVIEVEFATGGRMRICGAVAASTVSALMKVLANGKRRR